MKPSSSNRIRGSVAPQATVRDVARRAGVSVASVSRVLNGNERVTEEVRNKVLKVFDELGYVPHAAARALATRRFNAIGAVVPTLEDPLFAECTNALQGHCMQAGYTLLLACSNYDPDEEFRQIKALTSHGVAGMMLVGAKREQNVYDWLRLQQIPYINSWVLDDENPCVGFDNHRLGTAVANYLMDLGHERIGIIAQSLPNSDRSEKRVMAIRQALSERGRPAPQEWLIPRSHKVIDGRNAFHSLITRTSPPTAVICGTDTLALGAIIEAGEMNLKIPQDVSITGINDIELAAYFGPGLTTVRLHARQVGAHAANFLLRKIEGQCVSDITRIDFDLVIRGTTAPPPRGQQT